MALAHKSAYAPTRSTQESRQIDAILSATCPPNITNPHEGLSHTLAAYPVVYAVGRFEAFPKQWALEAYIAGISGYPDTEQTALHSTYLSPSNDILELIRADATAYGPGSSTVPDSQHIAAEYLRGLGWQVTPPAAIDRGESDDPLDQVPRLRAQNRFPAQLTNVRPERRKFRFTDEDFG